MKNIEDPFASWRIFAAVQPSGFTADYYNLG